MSLSASECEHVLGACWVKSSDPLHAVKVVFACQHACFLPGFSDLVCQELCGADACWICASGPLWDWIARDLLAPDWPGVEPQSVM